jgi:hypothetical protein
MLRILLQTTIPANEDDWHSGRFSLLREQLALLPEARVTSRDRRPDGDGDDPVLARLDESDFDELWLFAVDAGDGLTRAESDGINRFYGQGRGLLVTRDHQDLGASLCALERVGAAHYFHTRNPDPDAGRCAPDDPETPTISWPNYHSGANGDYQWLEAVEPVHPLLVAHGLPSGRVRRLPAHPHEGGVGVPPAETDARVVARGRSISTGRPFNLLVSFESRNGFGRAVADSSFHHFADYNWSLAAGCPTFVTERSGDGYSKEPDALDDVKALVRNLAVWLAGRAGTPGGLWSC